MKSITTAALVIALSLGAAALGSAATIGTTMAESAVTATPAEASAWLGLSVAFRGVSQVGRR